MALGHTVKHNNWGPTRVWIHKDSDIANDPDRQLLGWSDNGIQYVADPRYLDVPSDDFAGNSGAPSDAQNMGAIGRLSVTLHKYNELYTEMLSRFAGMQAAPALGSYPEFGSFVRQDALNFMVTLDAKKRARTYFVAFLRSQWPSNAGTAYARVNVNFECWLENSGVFGQANPRRMFAEREPFDPVLTEPV